MSLICLENNVNTYVVKSLGLLFHPFTCQFPARNHLISIFILTLSINWNSIKKIPNFGTGCRITCTAYQIRYLLQSYTFRTLPGRPELYSEWDNFFQQSHFHFSKFFPLKNLAIFVPKGTDTGCQGLLNHKFICLGYLGYSPDCIVPFQGTLVHSKS